MTTPRRDFLRRAGAVSLLAAAVSIDADAESPSHPVPHGGPWDLSWTGRVTGRFRAVFDSPDISGGDAVFRAMVWCDQYHEVYGTKRSDMSPVLVLRHRGLRLAMNDAFWKRFEIGKESKVLSPEGKEWAEANPVLSVAPDTPPAFSRYTLPQFIADGGIALGCGVAFAELVARIKQSASLSDAAADQIARDSLVPGVILQPSGVFAVLRAQEAGCKYILAS